MPKEMMQKGYLVINSSYTQAANPCSMRNQGPPRNVIYNFEAQSVTDQTESNTKRSQPTTKRSIKSMESKYYKAVPDYGRKENARMETLINRKCRPFNKVILNDYDEDNYVAKKVGLTVVKANDCTKNLSNGVFNPGSRVS